MEANITYPTDSHLLHKAGEKLVHLAKEEGIELRQTYKHVGKHLVRQVSGYAHAKQFKRLRKGVKKLKTYLGRVIRDIERQMTKEQETRFEDALTLAKRLLSQTKSSKNKVYSLHAPHVK